MNATLSKPAWIVVCRHSRDFHLGQAASVKRQFERQAGSDWDFVCLTDRPSEDWHLPLRTDWPGWWAILESFRLSGQPHVLTGLDTLLYGDLRPILRLAESCPPSVLYGIRDLGKPSKWASGVTVWNGDWSFIADRFDPAAHPRRFRGNQDYTAWAVGQEPGRHLGYLQDKVEGIVSYKKHLRGKHSQPPAGTRIVCFHGKPRPWNVGPKEAPWVGEFLQEHSGQGGIRTGSVPGAGLPLWQKAQELGITHVPVAPHTPNLGDDIQSEAACRWFGVRETVLRDQPRSWPPGSCVALCGWWAVPFLPPEGVRVALIGMHWDPRCWKRMAPADWRRLRELVKEQGFPLGCRDEATLAVARQHGVEAVFSGCVTQTLHPNADGLRQGRYAVDCTPPDASWECLTHCCEELPGMPPEERLALAAGRLEIYAQAEAVMTSRLHAFLPARALGVPSVAWRFDSPPPNPSRLSGHCPEFAVVREKQAASRPKPKLASRGPTIATSQSYSTLMNAPNDTLTLNAVLWKRDESEVLKRLNGESETPLRLRARHAGGTLELRETVAAASLGEVLRRHGVNLNEPVDLEVWKAKRQAAGGTWRHNWEKVAAERAAKNNVSAVIPPLAGHGPRRGNESSPIPGGQATSRRPSTTAEAGGPAALPLPATPALPAAEPVRPVRVAPMFFRADGGTMDLADLYHGQTLFLVLNGSSLKNFDWDKLKRPGICSFGVNNGAHGFRPQFWTCVDDPTRFMESIWRDPGILKFVPQAHFERPVWDAEQDVLSSRKVRDFPNVLGYRRNEHFQAAQWLYEDTINWGNHAQYGGGRSVMLVALRIAYLLGFRRVNLLGCDFKMDEKHHYWFDEERTATAIRNNTNSYRIMTGYFEQLRPQFERAGLQVFNCNPQSQLKVFPFADLDTALRKAEVHTSASTRGMYVDRFKPAPPPKNEGREILEPLLASVNGAEVRTEPFVHLHLAQVFSDSVYRGLLAHLPEDRHYTELRHADAIQPDGRSARLRFAFGGKEIAALPPEQRIFWQRMLVALRDPALEKALREKLKPGLHERFRESLGDIVVHPVVELIRDLPGYRIRAHTGIFKKVITMQFDLPEDGDLEALGTTFYRRHEDGKFEPALRMPFLPATGHAFAVNSRSWHGVDVIPDGSKPRNLLTLTYYLGKTGA